MLRVFLHALVSTTVVVAKGSGGGGGGGGGGYGGGGYGGGGGGVRSSNGSTNYEDAGLSTGAVIGIGSAICVLVVACLAFGVYYIRKESHVNRGHKVARQTWWNTKINKAQEKVFACSARDTPTGMPLIMMAGTTSKFVAKYTDPTRGGGGRRRPQPARGSLLFSVPGADHVIASGTYSPRMHHCLAITGRGMDRDGPFKISQGWVSPRGTCCWVEEKVSRNDATKAKTQALVTGQFTSPNQFKGKWEIITGTCGDFVQFDLEALAVGIAMTDADMALTADDYRYIGSATTSGATLRNNTGNAAPTAPCYDASGLVVAQAIAADDTETNSDSHTTTTVVALEVELPPMSTTTDHIDV